MLGSAWWFVMNAIGEEGVSGDADGRTPADGKPVPLRSRRETMRKFHRRGEAGG